MNNYKVLPMPNATQRAQDVLSLLGPALEATRLHRVFFEARTAHRMQPSINAATKAILQPLTVSTGVSVHYLLSLSMMFDMRPNRKSIEPYTPKRS